MNSSLRLMLVEDHNIVRQGLRSLLEGRGFSQDSVNPTLFVAPLYPFFLAAVYGLAGVHPLLVEILQAVLGTLTALVLYLLARDRFVAVASNLDVQSPGARSTRHRATRRTSCRRSPT